MPRRRERDRRLTAFDVFAGAGGLSLGLQRAGFNVLGAIEKDQLAAETYEKNFPSTFLWQRDVRRVSGAEIRRKLTLRKGQLDLLAGCPPCQGFSTVRTLNGGRRIVDPEQKSLLFEILRFARALRPKTLMLENVPGLEKDRRWKQFIAKLESLGYKCLPDVLNAADYGVPQRRRRLILLASRIGKPLFASQARKKWCVRDFIGYLPHPGKSGDPLHNLPENRSSAVRRLIARVPRNGGSRTSLRQALQLECHQKCDGFKDVYGRMKWDDVAPTITGGCVNPSKGRFLHPSQNRAISLREAALLQTFPRSYYFSLAKGKHAAAVLIGNALPPEFIRRHAEKLAALLKKRRQLSNATAAARRRQRRRQSGRMR
jgi:DNA (cytosine-5)-methyltransferase 1